MNNVNLNAGGVIGALVVGGIAAGVIFSRVDGEGGSAKLIIVAMTGGAFAGNFLWSRLFPKPEPLPAPPATPTGPSHLNP